MADPTRTIPFNMPVGTPIQVPVKAFAADGAITLVAGGIAVLTKGSAGAYTLAAPSADGIVLIIVAGSAQAHVVTVTGMAAGSGQDVGTFGGAINDGAVLVSYNSLWYIAGAPRNVTFA